MSKDRLYPYFATYDFEGVLEKCCSGTEKLSWQTSHRAVAVSIAPSVPGHEKVKSFVDINLDSLRALSMTSHLRAISLADRVLATEIWRNVLGCMDDLSKKWGSPEVEEQDEESRTMRRSLEML